MKLELRIVDLLARYPERRFTINQIAKSLNGHYSLVHRTANKLIGEGVIARERVGRSHICSLNIGNEKTMALMQLSEIEKKGEFYASNKELGMILEEFCKSIESEPGVISIVLFGSYARGDAKRGSDIDILLISRGKAGIDKAAKETYAKYGREINIIAMTPDDFKKQKDKPIIREIINNHCILYGAERFIGLVLE